MKIPPSKFSAKDLYLKGRQLEISEHEAQEVHKKHTLRGGSSGCISKSGDVYGTCHRKAWARFSGLQSSPEDIAYTWFDAGYGNEDIWLKKMERAVADLGPQFSVKSEEECPIKWEAAGVPVTGRPDIMVFEGETPVLGVELKVVCTVNSAINVHCKDEPKIDNLIQAAHYSMAHNCPFNLVYSFRSRSRVPGWAERYKDKLTLSYEKTFENSKTGRKFTKREYAIEPFIKEFKIGFEDDVIFYIKENGEKVITNFTASGIKKYYELVAKIGENKDLHTRVANKDLEGNILPYDPCNYCPLQEACDNFENDYDSWMDKVKLICEGDKDD
jgi:hypothetical protein